jgi:hypothetical protein
MKPNVEKAKERLTPYFQKYCDLVIAKDKCPSMPRSVSRIFQETNINKAFIWDTFLELHICKHTSQHRKIFEYMRDDPDWKTNPYVNVYFRVSDIPSFMRDIALVWGGKDFSPRYYEKEEEML